MAECVFQMCFGNKRHCSLEHADLAAVKCEELCLARGSLFFVFFLADYFQSTPKSTQRELPTVDDAIRVWTGLHDRFYFHLNRHIGEWRATDREARTDELGQVLEDGNLRPYDGWGRPPVGGPINIGNKLNIQSVLVNVTVFEQCSIMRYM